MTAPSSIDPARFLHDQLASASPDLLRSMLTTFASTLMSAEADAICGAPYGMPGPDRVNVHNGYRHRDSGTRAGTLDVAIPKLRQGSYFPDWLLERRRRAEAALTSVVATCYLLGVSTRRMEKLVESLGITRLSKSQVSRAAMRPDRRLFASSRRAGLEAWRAQIVVRRSRAVRSRQGPVVHGAHGSGWGCCSPPLPGARWRKAHGFASAAPGGVTSGCWSGRRPACWRTERACSAVPPRARMS